jgi:hypothetical protein
MFFASSGSVLPTASNDWRICQTSSPASGSVAMIMSIPITARGITAYGTLRGFVAKRRGHT